MIFSKDDLKFSILDAAEFEYDNSNVKIPGRSFHALSYRISSDAVLGYGGKALKVGGGSLTYFPAGLPYTRKCSHDKMLVIHLDIENYVGYALESVTPVCTDVRGYFERIIDICTKKQPGYSYRANALVYQMFSELYNEYFDGANIPSVIEKAVKEIHSRYTDGTLTVGMLAQLSGVSEVYFRRIFRAHFGVSPKQYITDLRIEYAKSLLGIGQIAVDEVAVRSGFSEPKHFAVAFKKKTGYPPSKHSYFFKRG